MSYSWVLLITVALLASPIAPAKGEGGHQVHPGVQLDKEDYLHLDWISEQLKTEPIPSKEKSPSSSHRQKPTPNGERKPTSYRANF